MHISCFINNNRFFVVENAGNPDPNCTPRVLALDSLSMKKVKKLATQIGLDLNEMLSLDEMKEFLQYRLTEDGLVRH